MKKLISIAAALALSLTLAACATGGTPSTGGTADSSGNVHAEDGYGEGRIADTVHTYFFDYTVNSAHMAKEYEGYLPAEGNELLVAEVTVKNTSTSSIEMYDTDFQVQWNSDDENAFCYPITTDPATFEELPPLTDEQLPGTYPLSVDEEVTGLLVYEVPAGNRDFSISYLEQFDDNSEGDTFFVFFTAEDQ